MPMPDLERLIELDKAHVLHAVSEPRIHEQRGPRIIAGGRGARIETGDGRTVIDGFAGLFNINVGHGRSEIADAVHEQMRKVAYYPSFWDFSTEPAIRLAERLAGLFPADRGLNHVLFTSGGSEANETNFKLARLYHAIQGRRSRQKILSRRHAYHGITRGAGSATTLPAYQVLTERDPAHVETAAPYCFRCEFGRAFPGCGMPCVEDVEAVIEREGADSIAALVVEPVQGTGGIIIPPEGYFDRLQEICRAHDILLILDEVITGFGRTGRWFGMEHWNIHPDLVTFAKGVTSGYLPLGGIAMSDRVYATLRDQSPQGLPLMIGLTYNNHPAACAAGLANLDILEREGMVDNARTTGAYLLERLRKTFADHPFVADIRGIGMLVAVEFTAPGTRHPVGGRPMAFTSAISRRAWDKGLIARALWDTISLSPPLCTTPEDADEIVAILQQSVAEVTPEFGEG